LTAWLLLIFGVAVLGVIPDSALSLRVGKEMLAEWALLLFLGSFIQSKWLRWFFWWSVVVCICNYNQLSYMSMTMLAFFALAFEVAVRRFSEDAVPKLATGLRILVLVQVGWMALQYAGWDPLFEPRFVSSRISMSGLMDNSALAGGLLAVMSPLFVKGWWGVCLPSILVAIFLTNSAGAILIASVLLSWCLWKVYGISWILALLFLMVAIGAYSVQRENLAIKIRGEKYNRLIVWERTLELCKMKPIKGWGLGQYKVSYAGIAKRFFPDTFQTAGGKGRSWIRVHNDYLQILFEQGIIGIGLLLGFLGSLLTVRPFGLDGWLMKISFVGLLLFAMYSFPSRLAAFGAVGLVLMVVLEGYRRDGDSRAYG
jgi:O-antigen ligase